MQGRVPGTLSSDAVRRMLPLVCVVLAAGVAVAGGYPQHQDSCLNDFAGVVQPQDAQQIRALLTELRDTTGIEAVVVTVNSVRDYGTGDGAIESFATNLFNAWGVGNKERNDGAMLLVAVKDRSVRIEVGSGFGTKLNAPTKRIIDSQLVPAFKRGDYSGGILSGTRALRQELDRWKPPAEAEETAIALSDPAPVPMTPEVERTAESESDNAPPKMNAPVQRAVMPMRGMQVKPTPAKRTWTISNQSRGDSSALGIIIALAAGGIGAGVAGLAFTRRNRCPRCKVKMALCDPARDYERLDDGQELEEKLNTVDYQFYRCPQCGHENMHKNIPWFSGYSQCPRCSYRTMKQSQDVLSRPTRHSTGSKLVTQDCKHCSYHREQTVILPMLPQQDHTHHGGSGGRGFGGSPGGGSFGGGHSSGGGSSGRW